MNTFDRIGQLTSRTAPASTATGAFDYKRDGHGYLTEISDAGGFYATAVRFDARGRLTSWTSGGGVVTTSSYDNAAGGTGRLGAVQIDLPGTGGDETLGYGFDDDDRVTTLTSSVSGARTFSYLDPLGRLSGATEPTATPNLYYAHDLIGNLLCLDATSDDAATACDGGRRMIYPSAGSSMPHTPMSISGVTPSPTYYADGAMRTLGTRSYTVNGLGQLTEVKDGSETLASYTFDGAGRVAKIVAKPLGQQTATTRHLVSEDFEWNETAVEARIHVSLAGQPIAIRTVTWSPPTGGGGGCGASAPGGFVVPEGGGGPSVFEWLYPCTAALAMWLALRELQRRRRGEPVAIVFGWKPGIAAATGIAFVTVFVVPEAWRTQQAAAFAVDEILFFHGDHLGSSVVVTNGIGALVDRVLYRPYGSRVPAGGQTNAPEVGFTGQRFEAATQLYDYGARFYDPAMGRFLQPDPIVADAYNPQTMNAYAYVLGSPLNFVDPTGMQADDPDPFEGLLPPGATPLRDGEFGWLDWPGGNFGLLVTPPLFPSTLDGRSLAGGSGDGSQGRQPSPISRGPNAVLSDEQAGNIVFNETRSLSGEGIDAARAAVANTIINAEEYWGELREIHARTAPSTVPSNFSPGVEGSILNAIRSVVGDVRAQRTLGIDSAAGATNFNLRTFSSPTPPVWAPGFRSQAIYGPFNNAIGPPQYINIWFNPICLFRCLSS